MNKRSQEPKLAKIFRLVPQIESTLNQMDQPVNKFNTETIEKLKIKLKDLVKEWYVNTQQLLLENQAGISNGFKADAFGILTGTTDFDKEDTKKKFSFAYLVNQYAKEIIEEDKVNADINKLPINPSEVLLECSNEEKATIDIELSNRDKISFDKKTGDATVKTTKGEIHKFKSFFGGVSNLVKNIWGWFVKQYDNVKNWFKNLFKKPTAQEIVAEKELENILENTINEAEAETSQETTTGTETETSHETDTETETITI